MFERKKSTAFFLVILMAVSTLVCAASAAQTKAKPKWMEGFDSGENWFGEDYAYDITDTAACWELLQRPVTVLDVGERELVAPLQEPGGKRVKNDKRGGRIAGSTAAVHVIGENENGWTLIEGMDEYDRLIRGYVRTKLLKTVTPNPKYGLIVDKLTQQLHVFIDGEHFSSCAISTGLVAKDAPYNETASGEYLISSWVGTFATEEQLVCEKAIRFNDGDLFHQVPYLVLGDGTKRFSDYEAKLGSKASHGCIRVARYPNDDGLDIDWLWDNLKKDTKVVIWDDDNRRYPYPDDDLPVYNNPNGGSRYHSSATCAGVKSQYHPLTEFRYGELEDKAYAKLTPCDFCTPAKKRDWIDQYNLDRGVITPEELKAERAEDEEVEETHETTGGAMAQPVEIVIVAN